MEPGAPIGPEEGQQGGENRLRVAFDASEELHSSARVLAAFRGVPLAELAREALSELIVRARLAEEDEDLKNAPKRGKNQKKLVFTKALKVKFHPILAAEAAECTLAEAQEWERTDPEFERANNEAQQYFIANHEIGEVLASIERSGKDRYLFWQSFQNAHNKYHGRLKGELMSGHFKDFMDRAFALAQKMFSPTQAKEFNDSLKETAMKQLSTMTD